MSSTKKILSAVISLTAAAAVITAVRYAVSDKNAEYTFSGFYFDTAVTCKTVSSDGSLSESCKSIVSELDKIASAYDENSAVYKIDHGEKFSPEKYPDIGNMLDGYKGFEEKFGEGITPFCGSLTLLWNISSDTPYVPTETEISAALENVKSSAEYDGTIPEGSLLDLGAGAKGYACDRLLEAALSDEKADEIVFSTGSSSLMWSREGRDFTAAVVDPINGGTALEFSCGSSFISTAGGYERYFEDNGRKYTHIMDIRTGCPAETDIASATVILPCESGNGLVSDLLSTLIYIGGTEKAEHYAEICGESFEDYGIITIDNSGSVTSYGSMDIVK